MIAGTSSLTINGGPGTDNTEFTGDYLVPNSNLTVNAETIKVDSGVTVDVGTGNITFNAALDGRRDHALGITPRSWATTATIELDSATLERRHDRPRGVLGNANTTVNGARPDPRPAAR